MGLFGKKVRRLATNAPHSWPAVDVDLWSEENPAVNYLAVGAALARQGPDLKLEFYRRLLYDDGVITIPLVVQEGDQRTAVFVYARADAESAALYSGTRALLRQRESLNTVYYAPDPITPARPTSPLQTLDTGDFSVPENPPDAAEYAVWWATPDDPLLARSPALAHLDRWFAALDGYTPFVFSAFVSALDLSGKEKDDDDEDDDDDEPQLYALPSQPLIAPVVAPGELAVSLHASEGEGLWFACGTQRTPPAKRNALLKQLADLAEELRKTLEGAHAPASRDDASLGFWKEVRAGALQKEEQAGAEMHVLTITPTGRIPSATTAEERARVVSDQPDEDSVDFAGQQLDFAVDALKRAHDGATGAETGEREPNLHPFLAMRAGQDVYRTALQYCAPPEAERLVPDLVAARRGVDTIALVYDGYLRQGDQRSDGLFVRVERRAASASRVFVQRYQLAPFGLIGNWVLMGTEASLFPQADESPSAPSAPLFSLVQECAKETLERVLFRDPSGAEAYDDEQPFWSPVLYVPIDGKTLQYSFPHGIGPSGLAFAISAASQALSERPTATLAVLVYDDMTTRNGEHARAFRFRAHERGTPRALEYAMAYEKPVKGRSFRTTSGLQLLASARALFPV
jgi:hypothetical protein